MPTIAEATKHAWKTTDVNGRILSDKRRYHLLLKMDWQAMVLLREALQSYAGELHAQQQATWITHERYNAFSHDIEELAKIIDAIDTLAREEGDNGIHEEK